MELNKIYNMDCLEGIKSIESESVDMVLTDPPYGMDFQSHRRKEVYDKIKNDNNLDFLDEYLKECKRIMKNDTAIYVFCSWHNVDVFKQTFEKYFKLKNIVVWIKNNHGSGDLQAAYAPRYEFILYGNKGRCKFKDGRHDDTWFFDKTHNDLHPTQKPIDLLEYAIKNSSNEGDVIFDGFMGSGSTAVAAQNMNRNFIGFELDENYCNVANERINTK